MKMDANFIELEDGYHKECLGSLEGIDSSVDSWA